MVLQPLFELSGREWTAPLVALGKITPELPEDAELDRGLHAFAHDGQSQGVSQADPRWAATVARNLAVDHFRAQRHFIEEPAEDRPAAVELASIVEQRMTLDAVREELGRLAAPSARRSSPI